MALITGQVNTGNGPYLRGALYALTPQETPFLSAIGAESFARGDKVINAKSWDWTKYDLRAPSSSNQVSESATFKAPTGRDRSQVSNVIEIYEETFEVSLLQQGATGNFSGDNNSQPGVVNDEELFQRSVKEAEMKRDVEASFLNGTYHASTGPTDAAHTRGIGNAITTNVIAAATAALTEQMIKDLMRTSYDNGARGSRRTLMMNSWQKAAITTAFKGTGYYQTSRTLAGVAIDQILTDFGSGGYLDILLNPMMDQDKIFLVDFDQCRPVYFNTPASQPDLAWKKLPEVGRSQAYSTHLHIGLEYGLERSHAKITGLATS